MNGQFIKPQAINLSHGFGLVFGIITIWKFCYFLYIERNHTLSNLIFCGFFICIGILACVGSIAVSGVVRKRFIHVEDDYIYLWCHFGRPVFCNMEDVLLVSFMGTGLTIYLKNGKRYDLMSLLNACEIGTFIQQRITAANPCTESQEELRAQIQLHRRKRIRYGILGTGAIFLIIPCALLCSACTNWKDLSEFSPKDDHIFLAFTLICMLLISASLYFVRKSIHCLYKQRLKEKTLQNLILHSAPLLPGNAKKVYLDSKVFASTRITVFGFPNSEDVYLKAEHVNDDFKIECFFETPIFENMDAIASMLEGMIEIPIQQ